MTNRTGFVTVTLNTSGFWPTTPQEALGSVEAERDHYRKRAEQYEKQLSALNEQPSFMAAVLGVKDGRVSFTTGAQNGTGAVPSHMPLLEPGMIVRVNSNGQVLGRIVDGFAGGPIHVVKRLVDDHLCEVTSGGAPVILAVLFHGAAPKLGDHVLLDGTGRAIVRNLGKPPSPLAYTEDTGISWDDIGGQPDAKRELREIIEDPHLHKDVYNRYRKAPCRGVLLWGPAGNGKTMLGKAAATALARIHGASAKASGYIYVKGPEILNKFVGASEAGVRDLFAAARAHWEENGYPAIVFIDEADAVLNKRGAASRIEGMERTIVPQFLAEMDGLDEPRALVLLATNRPDSLDPAVVRDKRVDRKVHVRRPSREDATGIITAAIRGRPVAKDIETGQVVDAAISELWSNRHTLYMVRMNAGSDERVTMASFVSGAMCVGIAERAMQYAMRREVSGAEPKGLTTNDARSAVLDSVQELKALDHQTFLNEYISEMGPRMKSVKTIDPVHEAERNGVLQ